MSDRHNNQADQDAESVAASVTVSEESSPGARLRIARETAGFSQHDVADALNLTNTVIQHLEGDVYNELPGLAFSIGYLRAYAKYLGLDADQLVEDVKVLTQSQFDTELVAHAVPVLDNVSETETSSGLLLGSLLVLGVVAIGVLFWWFLNSRNDAEQVEEGALPVVSDVARPFEPGLKPRQTEENVEHPPSKVEQVEMRSVAEAIQNNAPSRAVSFEQSAAISADESDVMQQLTAAQNSGASADLPSLVTSEPTSESVFVNPPGPRKPGGYENGARRITEEGDQLLEFRFTSDSWVEVQNNELQALYGDLNRSGTSLKLVGQGPFRVLLGYAPGVELSIDGVPVDLISHTRQDVARVVVGE